MRKDGFFEKMEELGLALSFDELTFKSGFSETHPVNVSVATRFSRNVPLHIPIVSAAMDTVTESRMAIAVAKCGGLGVIHRGMDPEHQRKEVERVKNHIHGHRVDHPITVFAHDTIEHILNLRVAEGYKFHSFPVLYENETVAGLLTRNDFDLCSDPRLLAKDVMTPIEDLTVAPAETNVSEAQAILKKVRKKILLLVDTNFKLSGMYVWIDIKRVLSENEQLFNVDELGHLRTGAAIGTDEEGLERAHMLAKAGCDVLVIDSAHGDTREMQRALERLKSEYPKLDIVAGNVSEPESAVRLADAGADGVKVGQGPGSICTTRQVTGAGTPQVTAIYLCAKALRGRNVPVNADGGIRFSGHIALALGLGAESVMLGRILAGTNEAPGEIKQSTQGYIKEYRGMGSLGAMKASKAARARYRQEHLTPGKLVPEGIEAFVPLQGTVTEIIDKLIGGLRSGMGMVGANSITDLNAKADFRRMTVVGQSESRPHDIIMQDAMA